MLLLLCLFHLTSAQTQCDLDHDYMVGDIAIPSIVDSDPMFADDHSKILTEEELEAESHSRTKRAAVRDRSRIWPDNTVPYLIETEFQDHYKTLLRKAMDTWEENTCIRFVPRTTEQDYINIRNGRRCCSYVGRQRRGAQKMALDPGCMQHGILLHELGHVIGFWHEQNRPDRDQFIRVINNYHHSVRYNFQKLNESQVNHYGVRYDYSSIMHYGRTFFSIDGKSTTLLPLEADAVIGQRLRLSPLDILQANRLYMCQKNCSWTYNATKGPDSIQSMNYPGNYPPKVDCITKIHASKGQVIRLNFEIINIEHHSDCSYDYLEVRDGDRATSPLLAKFCGDLPARNFTSSGADLWVKFHSDSSVSKSGFFAHFTTFDKDKAPVTKVDLCGLKTCAHDCRVDEGVATCTCPSGYYLNDDGFSCRDFNECRHNNGGCSHICQNSQGSFNCMCPRGYDLGQNNKTCIDIDECRTSRSDCSQVCVNTPGSYYCTCNPGYRLLSDYTTCQDVDECAARNGGCHQECHNFIGTYSCRCHTGYRLLSDNTSCSDIDECSINNGGCSHKCNNTIGAHVCGCPDGYQLDDSQTNCEDINECDVNKGGCEQVCVNSVGSYSCTCHPGYKTHPQNTHKCQDIDECQETDIKCDSGCQNNQGSYHCTCPKYFSLHSDGFSCIANIRNQIADVLEEVGTNQIENLYISKYRSQPSYCGDLVYTGPGLLESPLYPYNYPTNTKCAWVVTAKPGETVSVTFLTFDVEEYTQCRFDYVRVFDGMTEQDPFVANLCGKKKQDFTVSSTGSRMLLKFKSDYIYPRQGFSAIVDMKQEKCGGRYYTSKGSRELAFYTRSDNTLCLWTLTADHNRDILLNFIKFSMSSSQSHKGITCSSDEVLEVYNTAKRTILARFCNNSPPPKISVFQASQITIVVRGDSKSPIIDLIMLHSSHKRRRGRR